jgi:hypothetical protein
MFCVNSDVTAAAGLEKAAVVTSDGDRWQTPLAPDRWIPRRISVRGLLTQSPSKALQHEFMPQSNI